MPSPVPDTHRPAAVTDQSDSDHQSLDDDEEYEEIEVEEETEVEEDETEVEDNNDNDDDDDDDFGEDLSPVNQDHTHDATPDDIILGREDQSHSVSVTQESAVKVISTDMHDVKGDRGAHISDQMDVSDGRDSNKNHVNLPCSELGKDVISTGDHKFKESKPLSVKDNLRGNITGLYYTEEEKKHQSLQTEDIKFNEPRLDFPMAKASSLSPHVEHKDGTDKPAVICDFFAKGWCIKGKSCRFLHASNVTTQQHVGAEADASHKTERQTSEGSDCSSKKPRLYTSDEATPAVGTTYSLDRVLSRELSQSSKRKNEAVDVSPYKGNSSGATAGKEYLREENWDLNNHGNFGSEEMGAKRSQYFLDEHMPLFRHSWETNFNSGTLPPTHISSWTRSSLPYGSTCHIDPLRSHKCLDVERECGTSRSASLQKTSSPYSGSESNNPSRMPLSGDSRYPVGYKTEMSSYSWEPSPPFRPMFSLTQSLLSSVNQYDPIRDSIEQSKSADVYSRFSGAGRESFGSDYHIVEQSSGGHHNILDNNLNKNHGKDLFTAETGTPVSAINEMQNKIAVPTEEKLVGSSRLRHISKRITPNTENDYATQTDRPRQNLKSGDMAGQISEMEVDVKTSEDMAKETKALKHFRAALIDFVKELVKPTWREGNLSKDAHKMIVKRAVERVLSTVPTHQVPSTSESIELYLSSSELKIAKLVEGYIDKYAKL